MQILVTYGRFATALTNAADIYIQKFKGISICLLILTRSLVGYYVNFGVFELYGDPALKVRRLYGDTPFRIWRSLLNPGLLDCLLVEPYHLLSVALSLSLIVCSGFHHCDTAVI